MRINNHYIRNRHYRSKHWNRIRALEQPYKTSMPNILWGYPMDGPNSWSTEYQVKRHFEYITECARRIENGSRIHNHTPKFYRKLLNRRRDAQIRTMMSRINNGDYDAIIPKFKPNADWEYF